MSYVPVDDIYEKEIERLCQLEVNCDRLESAWNNVTPLFQYCTPQGKYDYRPGEEFDSTYGDEVICGCLTQIRLRDGRVAWTKELTDAILADNRIPRIQNLVDEWDEYTVEERREVLQVFAEWQRRLDKEIRGK